MLQSLGLPRTKQQSILQRHIFVHIIEEVHSQVRYSLQVAHSAQVEDTLGLSPDIFPLLLTQTQPGVPGDRLILYIKQHLVLSTCHWDEALAPQHHLHVHCQSLWTF